MMMRSKLERHCRHLVIVGRSVAVENVDGSLRIKAECHDYIRDISIPFEKTTVIQPVLGSGDPSLRDQLSGYRHPLPPRVDFVPIPDDFTKQDGFLRSVQRVARQLNTIRTHLRVADAALINTPSYRGFGALVWARIHGVPFVAHCAARLHRRSYDPLEQKGVRALATWIKELGQKVFELSALAFAPARTVDGPDLLATFGHLPGITKHSPPIVSFDSERVRQLRAKREEPPRSSPTILHVGALVPRKNIDTIIAAVAELRASHAGARLVLVGTSASSHKEELEELARGLLPAPGACEFTGYVGDPDEKHQRFAGADLLVCASYAEGFPRVIYEALAADIPVVATDLPGYRENMPDGAMELLEAGKDPVALAASMRRALTPPRVKEMQLRGGARARAMMSQSSPALALALLAAQGVPVDVGPAPCTAAGTSNSGRAGCRA
ncbi:MAG: hypothetical protein CME06_16340 [Gemmatimonadetes bacterium]|nr:hypothetical protein [Gemmatimonadota bacterium]